MVAGGESPSASQRMLTRSRVEELEPVLHAADGVGGDDHIVFVVAARFQAVPRLLGITLVHRAQIDDAELRHIRGSKGVLRRDGLHPYNRVLAKTGILTGRVVLAITVAIVATAVRELLDKRVEFVSGIRVDRFRERARHHGRAWCRLERGLERTGIFRERVALATGDEREQRSNSHMGTTKLEPMHGSSVCREGQFLWPVWPGAAGTSTTNDARSGSSFEQGSAQASDRRSPIV